MKWDVIAPQFVGDLLMSSVMPSFVSTTPKFPPFGILKQIRVGEVSQASFKRELTHPGTGCTSVGEVPQEA